ncbi:uncharacterized protein PHA67_000416 isoform 1-T1 [Liasis olivaceus]
MAATKLGIFLLLPVILQWVTGVTAAELIVYYEEYENSIIRYNGSGDFEDYYYDNSTYDYKEDWLKTNVSYLHKNLSSLQNFYLQRGASVSFPKYGTSMPCHHHFLPCQHDFTFISCPAHK